MKKMNFNSLIKSFGVPLKVYAPMTDGGGHYDDAGRWIKDDVATLTPISVNEPFLPMKADEQAPTQSGMIYSSEYKWYSTLVCAIGTRVVHNGHVYEVKSSVPYTDYSNVTKYFVARASTFDETRWNGE
ncbi:hypothetical protein EQG49_12810 [Periweissella cryptocerci]|uniref:Uncharacterized protein n=1 Tax=Periweissella cryptocerci TaxID=2506420 RepID=A0A4P6YWW2_9LACO|nr:hypothetical protein [Periweissella cryptocerci]QBO37277.1 hypothetical protein EQG49_12810 [Periweissella cryptocerci]